MNWKDFFLVPRPIDPRNPPPDIMRARYPALSSRRTRYLLLLVVLFLVFWVLPPERRTEVLWIIAVTIAVTLLAFAVLWAWLVRRQR